MPVLSEQKLNSMAIDVEALVNDVSVLVSLPEVYLKIRELMDDLDSRLDDFSLVINTDPALAATVLKVVNSAYYGLSGQVTEISRALNLIGIGQLHDLALTISAVGSLELSNDVEAVTVFWKRSIFCGMFSKLLGEHLGLKNAETLFIAGLLHEIGRLILFIKYPEESKQAISFARANNQSLTEIELEIFGTDFGKIGQVLMAQWKLPHKIQNIIGYQLDPSAATEYTLETNIIHFAHKASVNNFSNADSFQYLIDTDMLATLRITSEDMSSLCAQASDISQEMERMIFGSEN
ncbi:MAG: HDOD domain-containing protein [Methylophagaceae bacterium]